MKRHARALDVLLRLERSRLDMARAAVRDADTQHTAAIDRREQGRARFERERQIAGGDPALGPWLAAYLEATRTEARTLTGEIDRLEAGLREAAEDALRVRIECRRLELLAARAGQRMRYAQARREERALGELLPHLPPVRAGGR